MKKILIILFVAIILVGGAFVYFYYPSLKPVIKQPVQNTPGVSDTEIVLGSSLALSGHAKHLGINYLEGAMSYFNQINEEGGINGRNIRVVSYDDEYDPAKTIVNTQKLINEDKVFALFNYVGTPTTVKIIPLVEEEKIPLVGLFTGANDLRVPFKKYIFNIRASYYQETETAIKYFVDDLKLKKIAVFYQADAYGMDGLAGTEIALKKRGINPAVSSSYQRGTLEVEKAVEIITKSDAEAVVMVGTYSPCAKFIKLAKQKKPNMFFLNLSFVGPEELIKELGNDSEGVLVTQVVPPPSEYAATFFDTIRQYRKNLEKYYPETSPNFGGLEGFLNAKVITEALKVSGRDITREKFTSALESFQNYSLGLGMPLTFSASDHQELERVYLTVIKNKEFVAVF
jgi:ABC-type branched-subunit amino acid transport system substrate-binding protein